MKTRKMLVSAMLLSFAAVSLVSCGSDDDGGSSLPPIGGYNSADEVGSSNLVAYWGLNGDGKEAISGATPATTQGATFGEGVKGQGVTLTNGYLAYNPITNLSTTLNSFSISAWINVKNNNDTGGSSSVFLSLTRPNEWAGNINFMAETGWQPSTSDTLTVKGLIVSANDLGWQDTRNAAKVSPEEATAGHVAFPNKVAGSWAHAVLTWDGPSRMFKVYVNGQKISNPAWELRGSETSPAFAFATPTRPVIGALETFVTGTSGDAWNKGLTGKLDEIRVWNVALPQADINALYELEKAGR